MGGEPLALSATRSLRVEADAVVLEDEGGRVRRLDGHPLARRTGRLVHASADGGRVSVVARARGAAAYRIDPDLECRALDLDLERIEHAESLAVSGFAGGFVVISENGLVVVDLEGAVLWRVDGVTLGWGFVGEADAALYFSDAHGNLLARDRWTGAETEL
jgi:hypothetical protein